MKRLLTLLLLTFAAVTIRVSGQGLPYFRNFTADDYHAHANNFDVTIGGDGTVYIANFEGLLYYDHAQWHTIHTPGITRTTVAYCSQDDVIWVGGYNFFGKVVTRPNGQLALRRVGSNKLFRGEVQEIWEKNGLVHFVVDNGLIYKVKGEQVIAEKQISQDPLKVGISDLLDINNLMKDEGQSAVILEDTTQTMELARGLHVVVKRSEGLSFVDNDNRQLFSITEKNGLCSNNVNYVEYDKRGTLWGATDNGIFALELPNVFTRYTANEGLSGEVLSMAEMDGKMFVGTTKGLFRQQGQGFAPLTALNHACWDIFVEDAGHLLTATANGLYRVSADGQVRQLTTTTATALLKDGNIVYTGEMDAVYAFNLTDNRHRKVCELERVNKFLKDTDSTIWIQSLYGEVWQKKAGSQTFKPYKQQEEAIATIVDTDNGVKVVNINETQPFPYPLLSYRGPKGFTWLTDNQGKALYRWKNGKRQTQLDHLLHPFADVAVRALFYKDDIVWIGSATGIDVVNTKGRDPIIESKPELQFRLIKLGGDSILWGGYSPLPDNALTLASHERDLTFAYAVTNAPIVGKTLYRYKLNNGYWSTWSDDNTTEFFNLIPGNYTLSIEARVATGVKSEMVTFSFTISPPFYLKWYMLLLYLVLLALLIYALGKWRMNRLEKEKMQLENIVQERTAEVVKQKDEIEEKSNRLEQALSELHSTQHELIRQEKMATVGKLTQGLIDRILNPLNYVNNFAKLSEGLLKDLEANIDDDKEQMTPENYDDTKEVIEMIRGNLSKVGKHGQSTTRILKAMEEMLKDRSGGMVATDLLPVLRHDTLLLQDYFKEKVSQYNIKTRFDCHVDAIRIKGNADQLSMTFMSMLANAVHAVTKKAERQTYEPEIVVTASLADGHYIFKIHDNGIGIEEAIIDKIYDPFFTTKPTSEAAGVGLYLSREIIQNHKGEISVQSVKDKYTEFTITIPALTE